MPAAAAGSLAYAIWGQQLPTLVAFPKFMAPAIALLSQHAEHPLYLAQAAIYIGIWLAYEPVVPKSKEVFNMGLNAFLERRTQFLMDQHEARGLAKGRQEGRAEREQELVAELQGKPADEVAAILERIAQKHRNGDRTE